MTTQASMPAVPVYKPMLLDNGRKARYGSCYVRNLCAQAGLGFTETSIDEDAMAVDGDVKFREGYVGVQIKCSSQFKIHGKSASWDLEDEWVGKWNESSLPIYFILVIVPKEFEHWLSHEDKGTFHRSAAYWVRVDTLAQPTARLTIPKSQRLRIESFQQWHTDLRSAFSGSGGQDSGT